VIGVRKERFMKPIRSYGIWIGSICLLVSLFGIGLWGSRVQAAGPEYPTRTINFIVPFPPGGSTDLGARSLAEAMEKHLKQPVVVMNKVGGGTTVGGYAVASAKPDGYTLGFLPPGAVIPEAYTFFQDAPYTSKELKFICAAVAPLISVAVKEDAPWNTFKEFVEYAKKNPGLKVGTAGKHTAQHMLVTTLNKMEKTGLVAVPFSGDATNLPAMLGGHTSVAMMDYSALKSLVEAKKVKVLAVVTSKRADFAPNIPTVVELGYPIVYMPLLGLTGPKGLPGDIVEKIDNLAAKICTEPEFQAKMRNIPLQVMYENAATYEKTSMKFKDNILAHFKEEGLVK
jgi:tripartite-type tricarboxylate transporter receptor subunit TctC